MSGLPFVSDLGKLDDEDGIFGRQPNQHHQAYLGVDLFFIVAAIKPAKAPNTAIGVPSSTLNGQLQLSY